MKISNGQLVIRTIRKGFAYVRLIPGFGLAFGVDKNSTSNDYALIILCFSFEWTGLRRKKIAGVTSINEL